MSRDIPIIFSAPMVLALLREAGEPGTGKTMTRRLLYTARKNIGTATALEGHRPPNGLLAVGQCWGLSGWEKAKPGDRVWVRESLKNSQAGWLYAADGRLIEMSPRDSRVPAMVAWAHHKEQDHAPSIHMPRWASRLTLVVTATKIEPLQKITPREAIAEGVGVREFPRTSRSMFVGLWDSLHGIGSWDENPEVVALTFQVHGENIDSLKIAA